MGPFLLMVWLGWHCKIRKGPLPPSLTGGWQMACQVRSAVLLQKKKEKRKGRKGPISTFAPYTQGVMVLRRREQIAIILETGSLTLCKQLPKLAKNNKIELSRGLMSLMGATGIPLSWAKFCLTIALENKGKTGKGFSE